MSFTQAEDSASEKSTSIPKERRFKLSRYFFSVHDRRVLITSVTGPAIDVGRCRLILLFILGSVYFLSTGEGGSNVMKVTHVRPV